MRVETDLVVCRDLRGLPVADLAFEADLLERAGRGAHTLFLYSWEKPAVVLGYGQPEADVDLDWCRRHSLAVLRRLTGGTGVVHCRDLAVSLALPASHPWAAGIVAMYGRFLEALSRGLRKAGAAVELISEPARPGRSRSRICFEDQQAETLLVGRRKVVGCAQARRRGGVLIHAAVSLGLRPELYAGVFRSSEDSVRRGLADALADADPEHVAELVIESMTSAVNAERVSEGAVAPSEAMLRRYDDARWAPMA